GYSSLSGNPFIQVDWVDVGYAGDDPDLRNTFTLYIEDDPAGDIVVFYYHDMQWTTGDYSSDYYYYGGLGGYYGNYYEDGTDGFGGQGAQIGINSGYYGEYVDLGRPSSPNDLEQLMAMGYYAFRLDPVSGAPAEGNEPGLAGVTVYVDLNNNGVLDVDEPVTTTMEDDPATLHTDETGYYEFVDIFAGEYTIRELVDEITPGDWIQTFPQNTDYLYDESITEIFTVDGSQITDEQTFSVNDGNINVIFEFDDMSVASGVAPGHVPIYFSATDTAETIASAIAAAINASPGAAATLTLEGENNDLTLTGATSDPALGGVTIYMMNSMASGDEALITFEPFFGWLIIDVDPTATTANTLIDAINAEGSFIASLNTDAETTNDGTGLVVDYGFLGVTEGIDIAAYALGNVVTVQGIPAVVDVAGSPLAMDVLLASSHGNPDGSYTIMLDPDENIVDANFGNYRMGHVTISDVSIYEGDIGLTELQFTLHMTESFAGPVEVYYSTQDNTATVINNDYKPVVDGVVNFIPQTVPDRTWETFSLTSNGSNDYDYKVSGSNIVWEGHDGNDWEIFLYDGTSVLQLTDNETDDHFATVSGDNVVWSGFDGKDDEIFLYDGTTVRQLTNNNVNDNEPQVSDVAVVWWIGDDIPNNGDQQIYYYDIAAGAANPGVYAPVNISIGFNDNRDPRISGANVVWSGYDGYDEEIYHYDGVTTTQLTDNSTKDRRPEIDGLDIVWEGYDGEDYEIFVHTLDPVLGAGFGTTRQVTNNGLDDLGVQISQGNVVWSGASGTDWDIFRYNITANFGPVNISNNPFLDQHPQIDGDRVVWHRFDGEDWEVFYYELEGEYYYSTGSEYAPSNVSDNETYDWYPQVSDSFIVWRSHDNADYEIMVATPGEPETTMTISIPIQGDTTVEPDETFFVNLTGAEFALLDTDQAVGGILNDDGDRDFGDAPASYPTLLVDDGARHLIVPDYYLGNGVDAELNGRPNASATGDDNNITDDEDGVMLGANSLQDATILQDSLVGLTVFASDVGMLDAWIDFNADGDWDDPGEQIFGALGSQALVAGENQLFFQVPTEVALGATFARFRFSSMGGLDTTGYAADGEVEDYRLNIMAGVRDYGDAPAGYPTLLADDGPRHVILPGFHLGSTIDFDADGQPSAQADGDDQDKLDDEDGITFSGPLMAGTQATITVDVVNDSINPTDGYLNGWIDFNADGDWDDPGEQVITDVMLDAGSHPLTFDVPADLAATDTFARFRYSHVANLLVSGVASNGNVPDGEVEDYMVPIVEFNATPTVVMPFAAVVVDEDADDRVIDLASHFDDAEPGTLTYEVMSNTNPTLVAATVEGSTLTIGFAENLFGNGQLVIRATDAGGLFVESSMSVLVFPQNDTPTVADPFAQVTVDEDAADWVIDLSPHFADIESSTLTYEVVGNTNDTLVGTTIVDATLTLAFAPNQNGTAELSVRATDSGGESVEQSISVKVNSINDAPTVTSPFAPVVVVEDAPDRVIDLSAHFGDIDSTALTFAVVGNTNDALVGTTIEDETLTLAFALDQHGTATLIVRATDGDGLFVEQSMAVTVQVLNDAPMVVAPIGPIAVDEDALTRMIDLSTVFDDVDSIHLQYSVVMNTNESLVNATVDSAILLLDYQPNQFGSVTLTVRATDDMGLWVEDIVDVTVNAVNDAPTITDQATLEAVEETELPITLDDL
ncbi:MAG TPA: GEVED domain-containing protein, partial [Thermoguttaceae bacterium]|nr:GEVED domain-containing protein [Thermoguttaceae bacterium]